MAVKLVDVTYKNLFQNLNVEIKSDQIFSVVGKNGSGKTSFLNLIFGLDKNFVGKIVINRKNITSKIKVKELEKIREKMFYLSQNYQNQLFNINIYEDIKYRILKLDEQKLDELLKSFGLNGNILTKNYSELSDSEIKRILIIIMLIRDSKILLLDDPTNGLDQKSVDALIKILRREKRNGKTVIIASQDSEFLFKVSDNILIINSGKLVKKDNKYEFFENQDLLNSCGLQMPNIMKFRETVLKRKNVKLVYRDNINDLIKDIYRNVK